MDSRLDNPAARLHAIFMRLKAVKDGQSTFATAWKLALKAESIPFEQVASKIALVYTLPSQIDNELQKLDFYDSEWMHWWRDIAPIMQYGLDRPWSEPRKLLTSDVIQALNSRSKLLRKFAPEPTISDAAVEEIYQNIDAIEQAIRSADSLEDDLRDDLLAKTRVVRFLLSNIEITGGAILKTQMDIALAGIVERLDKIEEKVDDPVVGKNLKRNIQKRASTIIIALASLNTVSDAANNARNILESFNLPQIEAKKELPDALKSETEENQPECDDGSSDEDPDDPIDVPFRSLPS